MSLKHRISDSSTDRPVSQYVRVQCEHRRPALPSRLQWFSCAIFSLNLVCASQSQLKAQITTNNSTPQQYTPTVVGGVIPVSNSRTIPGNEKDFGIPSDSVVENYDKIKFSEFDESKAVSQPALGATDAFEAGKLVAVIGSERILVGDLFPPNKITSEIVGTTEFEMRLRKALVESVTRKSLANYFFEKTVTAKNKKEREEIRGKMNSKIADIFVTKILPEQLEKMKCDNRKQLQQKLEEMGSSEHSMMREFTETMWAQRAIFDHVPEKPSVDLYDLQDYYKKHPNEWHRPLRVRFRILSAMFKKYPNRDAAYADIVAMGNEVFFGGAFEGVAKKKSSGFNADEGGKFDWTTQGALKSKPIEDVVFNTIKETNKLSPIIEDSDGFHIVEVLEREEEYTMTFAQSQSEIRKKLVQEKQDQSRKDFIKKVREDTKIWTRWPEDIPGSEDVATILN